MYPCAKLMVFKGLCCRQRGDILNSWPFYRIVVETKWSDLPGSWVQAVCSVSGWLMSDGWMWLLAKCCFPQSPHVTQAAVQSIWVYVQLSWCAMDGHVHLAFCCWVSLHITTVPHKSTSIPPLLSLQMKDHTQRGARSPGQLTNHIHPRGAASQVQYSQTWLHIISFSISCLIHALAARSRRRRRVMLSLCELFVYV